MNGNKKYTGLVDQWLEVKEQAETEDQNDLAQDIQAAILDLAENCETMEVEVLEPSVAWLDEIVEDFGLLSIVEVEK